MSNTLDIRRRLKLSLTDAAPYSLLEYSTTLLARNTSYLVNDRVRPTVYSAHTYRCTFAGTSHATIEPSMPTSVGFTVVDGTVVWTEDSDDYDQSILSAVNVFTRHLPSVLRIPITGDGSSTYSMPAGWINEFSRLLNIEFPVGEVPPVYLDNDRFTIYQSSSSEWKIMLFDEKPISAQTFVVYFTGTRTSVQIPDGYLEAFLWLCSGLILSKFANSYLSSTDSSISADVVDFITKAEKYREQADYWIKKYEMFMGVGKGSIQAAFYTGRSLTTYPYGIGRLTHSRLSRYTRGEV